MKALAMEFYKTRRRKVWLIVAALIAVQLLWGTWSMTRWDTDDLAQGWMFFLYQFPLLNCILMPVIAAVVASRLIDVEHKGQAFKLLKTVMPAGRLFDAKFLCGTVYMGCAAVIQLAVILLLGVSKNVGGDIPIEQFGFYLLSTTVVSMTILLLQQILSLQFANQLIPLAVGLVGGLFGLFSMFFSKSAQRLLLWGYYGVLASVGMNWDKDSRITNFYWTPPDWRSLVLLLAIFCVMYTIGRILFVKREQ